MNWILLPYIANIIILVPVGLGTLFDLFPISGGHFPESLGWRTIVGSMWIAILICSILGLIKPLVFSPLLLLQVIYKGLWLVIYALPQLGRDEMHWGITIIFTLIVISYPFIIPWKYLL